MTRSSTPRPAPCAHSRDRRGVRVVVEPDRHPEPLRACARASGMSWIGMFTDAERGRRAWSIARRDRRSRPRATLVVAQLVDRRDERVDSASCDSIGVARSRLRKTAPVARRPPRRGSSSRRGRRRSRACRSPQRVPYSAGWPPEEKPYRVYRGGRRRGRCRSAAVGTDASTSRSGHAGGAPDAPRRRPRRRWTLAALDGSSASLALIVLLDRLGGRRLLLVRAAASRTRTSGSCRRTRRRRSTKQNGLILDRRRTILLLGTDHATTPAGTQRRPALRLDHAAAHRPGPPPAHLPLHPARPRRRRSRARRRRRSTPRCRSAARRSRSRRVEQLHRRRRSTTSSSSTSAASRTLIDAVGGDRRSTCRRRSVSNRFDCPYATAARCRQWQGWRFHKGTQHMDGHTRAHLLAHPREPARPGGDRHHARPAPAGGHAGDRWRSSRAVGSFFALPFDGGDAAEADHHRPLDAGSSSSSAG